MDREAESSGPGLVAATAAGPARRLPHERIVDVARELFCRDGIHATGIDRILSEAGASKMTLYSRFGSKEMLLREVLRAEGADWRDAFFRTVTTAAPDAQGRLDALVDALATWFRGGRFYGCAFMNAAAEHTKGQDWLRALAADHHRVILDELDRLAFEAGYAEPAMLARQLLLLVDGVIAALMVSGDAAVLAVGARNLRAILAAERCLSTGTETERPVGP